MHTVISVIGGNVTHSVSEKRREFHVADNTVRPSGHVYDLIAAKRTASFTRLRKWIDWFVTEVLPCQLFVAKASLTDRRSRLLGTYFHTDSCGSFATKVSLLCESWGGSAQRFTTNWKSGTIFGPTCFRDTILLLVFYLPFLLTAKKSSIGLLQSFKESTDLLTKSQSKHYLFLWHDCSRSVVLKLGSTEPLQ